MRTGLAIVTCVPTGCPDEVRKRLPAALDSLRHTGFPGPVSIIDDGSTDPAHLAFLEFTASKANVIRRPRRGGIARAKNTALRVLQGSDVDIGFLAEDDIEFSPGWWEAYIEAHVATRIHHFSWAWDEDPSGEMQKTERMINNFPVVETSRVNGVFLTFTPKVLQIVGGFKILPALWGHEHTQWSRRMVQANLAPFFADLPHSDRYLRLNSFANYSAISDGDRDRFDGENAPYAEILDPIFEPLTE